MEIEVKLKNILMDGIDEHQVNSCVKLVNDSKRQCIKAIIKINNPDAPEPESNSSILRHAIELSVPKVMIQTDCRDETYGYFWKTRVFLSYYGDTELKYDEAARVSSSNIENINGWMQRILKNKELNGGRFTSWNVAYNEYLSAMSCGVLEKAFMHLITALEAVTLTGNGELIYRVSLNTAMLCEETYEKRKEVFEIVKKAYSLRSATVHGDIKSMKKRFKDQNLYDLMFELRKIVSKALYITYGTKKEDNIEDINKKILS